MIRFRHFKALRSSFKAPSSATPNEVDRESEKKKRVWVFEWVVTSSQELPGQPRSQGLSSLPPWVVGRKTLVAAGHVTTCDTNYSTGVESINNFCRSQLAEAKERSSNELHL